MNNLLLVPVLNLSKIFAMCDLFVNKKNKNQFQRQQNRYLNIFYYFRLICLISVIVFCVIYRQYNKSIYNTTGVITVSVQFTYYNCRIPIVIICLICTNVNSKQIEEFLNRFNKIDDTFRKYNCPTDYKNVKTITRILFVWFFVKIFIQHVPYFVDGFNWDTNDILDYFVMNLPMIVMYILTLQWSIYLHILRINFITLNSVMKSLKFNKCWVVNDYISVYNKSRTASGNVSDIIRKTGCLYDSLCMQGDRLNRAYAWQILFIVPALFIMIIYSSFDVCQMIKEKEEFDGTTIVFDIMYFITFLELILPCVFAKEIADKFVDSLHSIDINFEHGHDLEEIVNSLTLQTYHQKLEFSTFGVFPLDGTLIYSVYRCSKKINTIHLLRLFQIFGALTTYLVILLQFDV